VTAKLGCVLAIVGIGIIAACGKGGGVGGGSGAGTALIETWRKGGLEPSAFAAAQTPVGKDCIAGTVGGVDVLVCTFATPDEAKAAQDAGLQWVGDTTGSSQAKGNVLIAAADRRKADPKGKTINQIFKLAAN
jgi:hypothetical protein